METVQTAIQSPSGVKRIIGPVESDLSQLGNHLIQKFHALMKVSLIYDSKNKVLQPFLQDCLHVLNGLMEREGTVSLKVVKDDFYLNENRLRFSVEAFTAFKHVLIQWKKRLIGEVVFRGPMDERALREFISILVRLEEGREENADLFTQRLAGNGIASIEVIHLEGVEEKREGAPLQTAGQKTAGPKEVAKRVFFQMIRVVKEITLQIERQEPPNLRKFKRLVQKVIRLSGEDESTLRPAQPAEQALVAMARTTDIAIVGQADRAESDAAFFRGLTEAVVLAAGRPAIVVPFVVRAPTMGDVVLIAWNETRESARAVADALPLLVRARRVDIMTVESGENGGNARDDARLREFLGRHAVPVGAIHRDRIEDIAVGELLLSRAADLGSDLIVMGAYAHTRIQERILGGVTRTMLDTMTVPVLMSH